MKGMALPIREVELRQSAREERVISPDFSYLPPEIVTLPWQQALEHFLANGNAPYVKNWVKENMKKIPELQRVIFLDTLANRSDFFFEMLTTDRQVELVAIVNDFLTRDWD